MSEYKLNGTIIKIGDVKSIGEKGFKVLDFVVKTDEQYPQEVKLQVVKEKAEKFAEYHEVGNDVEVKFNIRGREYQENHYVNLEAWFISNVSQEAPKEAVTANEDFDKEPAEVVAEDDELPF